MLRALLILLVAAIGSTQALGGIIINVESKNFTAGGLGFVEVYISSDETTVDEISLANYEFQITPTGPNGIANGELKFRLDADQSTDEQTDSTYVFFPDNTGITTVVSPNQLTIQGEDTDGSGNNVLLTATPKLLARFELVHTSATPSLAVGDTFTIGLINNDLGNADPLDDSTFFADNSLNVLTYQVGSDPSAFVNFGTITITSAAVPEPSTFAVLAMVGAGVVGRQLRRRKAMVDESRAEG
jgi:hypothetical protein